LLKRGNARRRGLKTSAKPRGTPNGCRILVVDDDADNVDSLLELLRLEGYLASAAANGAAALALLADGFDPDVVLTDLMMPVMSGWDFCESLKSTTSYRSIPVIVTCGMAVEQRGKLQVDAAFEKPVDIQKLLSIIEELCGL